MLLRVSCYPAIDSVPDFVSCLAMPCAIGWQPNLSMPDARQVMLQAVIVTTMVIAAKLHAHPLERVWLLLPFFIGAAEIASGVSGL